MSDYEDVVEDTLGMKLTSGTCTLTKDSANRVGVSIGGGAPYCPCVYFAQVFDDTPAFKDGSIAAGDEIISINGLLVKGKTRVEVAKLIQASEGQVTIHYNKLHAQAQDGKTLDIILKKVKHRIVESMSSATADALGLSRAILTNDHLIKKFEEFERLSSLYKGLIQHSRHVLRGVWHLSRIHRSFGDVFANIGAREPQRNASLAFTKFGEVHRQTNRFVTDLMHTVKPMIADLNTYLSKAIPDTRLTIEKYADAKFEYLVRYHRMMSKDFSYCLKVKEMDDEESNYHAMQEILYRVETGNYEYRLVLRCRQLARERFAKLRSDVMVKLELLDQKHVQGIVFQLQRFIAALAKYHRDCNEAMKEADIFPIEVELDLASFQPKFIDNDDDDDEQDDETSNPTEIKKDANLLNFLD